MKVLLLQDVKKLGRKYDIKEVSDGYARNFLLAKKLAVAADAGALKLKTEAEAKEKSLIGGYQEMAKKLAGEVLEFKIKAGAKGEVFGSVKSDQVKQKLESMGYRDAEPILEHPLKATGEQELAIKFPRGITGKTKIKISAI